MCLGWAGARGARRGAAAGATLLLGTRGGALCPKGGGLGGGCPPSDPSCIPGEGAGSDPGRRATPWPTSTGGLEGQSLIIRN